MKIPRIVVGGTHSGVGKTTVATGLMGALARKGRIVQGFKIGPDFLDTTFHSAVTKRPSRNLDSWMIPIDRIPSIFTQGCQGADIAIIEGVMGIFDGLDGKSDLASTSEIARKLEAPVLLVMDVYGLAGSAAAVALGYKMLDPHLKLGGIILNRVAGETHAKMCRDAIVLRTNVPVLGAVPVDSSVALPERHLGLFPAQEMGDGEILDRIIGLIESSVNLDRIEALADSASELGAPKARAVNWETLDRKTTIGVARDRAFSFYYQENLDSLAQAGAELRFFSPLVDERVPEGVDGLYIGGGYPEVYSSDLSKNKSMLGSIAKLGHDGTPIYAECGGLMYLTRSIEDLEGTEHETVGLLDGKTSMVEKLTLSYTLAKITRSNLLSQPGANVRGHEYHYSTATEIGQDAQFAYEMKRGMGIKDGQDGWTCYNTLASYMHMSFASDEGMAQRFVNACVRYSKR